MPTYEASIQCAFSAGHALRLPDGKLEQPHEHAWRVTATFRSDRLAEPMGIVIDFTEAQRAMEDIAEQLEGANLNSLAMFKETSPSAERVAEFLAERLGERLGQPQLLYSLAVTEAPGYSAAFYPGGQLA